MISGHFFLIFSSALSVFYFNDTSCLSLRWVSCVVYVFQWVPTVTLWRANSCNHTLFLCVLAPSRFIFDPLHLFIFLPSILGHSPPERLPQQRWQQHWWHAAFWYLSPCVCSCWRLLQVYQKAGKVTQHAMCIIHTLYPRGSFWFIFECF